MRKDGVQVNFSNPARASSASLLPYILFLGLSCVVLMWFISRQARGQMSGIMSIGRSRARLFSAERPVDHLRATWPATAG